MRNTFLPLTALSLLLLLCCTTLRAQPSLGLREQLIVERPVRSGFPLVTSGAVAPIWYDANDHGGVVRAIGDLATDMERVTGRRPLASPSRPADPMPIIVGTVGKSSVIDALIATSKLDATDLRGKWETFVITTVITPVPGVKRALVIAGSDKRGTIYGVYELSEQLGVSPWYWWADVPVKKRTRAYVRPGRFTSGEPAVRYRGIFLNDEAPCLAGWTREKFGGMSSKFYTKVFELLLRLRANYLWPAMWDNAFHEDDPDNARLADEYGIVMGTSHHEPMMRAHKEWTTRRAQYGNGAWNYATNADAVRRFFREGIARGKRFENIVTIGMRGDGDVGMESTGSMRSDIELLEHVMADQRQILSDEMGMPAANVPQLWALFTEVQRFYEQGMRVPDDVTLLWTDDNTGSLRRLPTPAERQRAGGAGIYYHFDMHGGPYAYQWINTNNFPKIWEQMNLAYRYGATRIWIVNVGDLKPLELPIEFFMRLAWNPAAWPKEQIAEYTRRWAERDFGPEHAAEIADVAATYMKYNGWRKPEVITPQTFSLTRYREAERVVAAWQEVTAKAEKLYETLPAEQRDAFFQLVLHPTKASAIVSEMNVAAGRSLNFARQGRASANVEAARTRELFKQDQALSDYYNHELAGGKWNHLMDQAHLGQFSWEPPRINLMPPVSEILLADNDNYGVAIEGDIDAWPGHFGPARLPILDSLNPQRTYIEVFAEGTRPIAFTVAADQPWIVLEEDTAPWTDRRFWVDVDWSKLPSGTGRGTLRIEGKRKTVEVEVTAVKATQEQARAAKGRFASLSGPISMVADDAAANIARNGARWESIPNYGRGRAGMSIFPQTAPSVLPPAGAPRLDYPVYLPRASKLEVTLVIGPVMDFVPERGMRVAVSFDDQPPQVLDIFADRASQTFLGTAWREQVTRDNVRYLRSTHAVDAAGAHELRVSMVDPGIVLQKIIIDDREVPASYFGPPENVRVAP